VDNMGIVRMMDWIIVMVIVEYLMIVNSFCLYMQTLIFY